jgi:hypothetical protein
MARRVHEHGRSIGMALTSCTVPTAGRLTFELGDKAGPVTRTSAAQVIRVPVLSPAGSCSKAWQTSVQQQVSRHDAQSACSTPQCQAG